MGNKASDIIVQLQELVAEHGDLDVWVAADDEGNGYNQLWSPQLGYIRKEEADDYRQESISTDEQDLLEEAADELDVAPSEVTDEQFKTYLAENYVAVIVH